MHSLATFRSTYPHAEGDLPGRAIVEQLTAHLVQAGFEITPRGTTEYAHTFVVADGDRSFLVELTLVDGDPQAWFCLVDSRLSLVSRVFGRSNDVEHRRLLSAVNADLSKLESIGDLQWHEPDLWDGTLEGGRPMPTEEPA